MLGETGRAKPRREDGNEVKDAARESCQGQGAPVALGNAARCKLSDVITLIGPCAVAQENCESATSFPRSFFERSNSYRIVGDISVLLCSDMPSHSLRMRHLPN